MKRSTIGALLLLVLGGAAVFAWVELRPRFFEWSQRRTSDALANVNVRIGGDNYLGYWFLTSPEMRKQAARQGLGIQLDDDGGAYAERLAKFAAGEYDLIVLPVSSYLQHGATFQFPGVIVAAIAESRGADGIVTFEERLATGSIADLNDADLSIVYTAASPSEFLLDLTIADFDLDELRGADRWRVEAEGSRAVYDRARAGQGDVFVLWEPDLSRALSLPDAKYIWGSDRFSGYIVDVLVAHRDFLAEEGNALRVFLELYFEVIERYGEDPERLVTEMRRATDLDAEAVQAMLDKIEWLDLEENRRGQLGIARTAGEAVEEGLIDTIISSTDVMLKSGRLERDPLDGNPYLITNSRVLQDLVMTLDARAGAAAATAAAGGAVAGTVDFAPLDDEGWAQLRTVGTFRVEPITFQSWNNLLSDEGKAAVDRVAQLLDHHYRDYRITVTGHTAPGGDEAENEKLSLARAQAVVQYLKAVHDLDVDRLRARGAGSAEPPRKRPGESPRAYRYRLSRVEFTALEANPL